MKRIFYCSLHLKNYPAHLVVSLMSLMMTTTGVIDLEGLLNANGDYKSGDSQTEAPEENLAEPAPMGTEDLRVVTPDLVPEPRVTQSLPLQRVLGLQKLGHIFHFVDRWIWDFHLMMMMSATHVDCCTPAITRNKRRVVGSRGEN